MPRSKVLLNKILKRDRICGRHIDGCGKLLHSPQEATVGHLIPQSFYKTFDPKRAVEFAQDWNVQPECAHCNNERGGMLDKWPLFKCKCHYLWIDKTGPDTQTIYLAESLQGSTKKHRLHEWRTDHPPPKDTKWLFESDATLILAKVPPRGETLGWSNSTPAGHIMIPIPEKAIPIFNWLEYVRIETSLKPAEGLKQSDGRTTRELRCRDDKVEYLVNGEVKQLLPRREGFRNLSYFGVQLDMPDNIVSIAVVTDPI